MNVLRVLLTAPADPNNADDWALFDASGICIERGHGSPATWPDAARHEAVIAASWVRLIALALPPLPSQRVTAAARFALEDRLAAPLEDQTVAVSAQESDGIVIATVIATQVLSAIERHPEHFARVIAEPALTRRHDAVAWYRSAGTQGFVRMPDGGAFAVDTQDAAHVPRELDAALRQLHGGMDHTPVQVAFEIDDERLERLSAEAGQPVQRVAAWHWDEASPAQFAAATDLRVRADASNDSPNRAARWRTFKPALALLALALLVQVGAMFGEWAYLRIESWRMDRAFLQLAHDAGIADATDRDSAMNALALRYAQARHRAGLPAPTDALPLLARAAPHLAALPSGALRSAHYGGGAWTVELGRADPAVLARLSQSLTDAGLAPLYASNATGTRLRLTLAQ